MSGLLEISLAVGLLISMNWILVVITAVLTVITLLIPKIMEKKNSQALQEVNKSNTKLLASVEHWLGGLQELCRYSAYSRLSRQLHQSSTTYIEASKKSYKYRSIAYLFNGFGNSIAQIGMSLVAGILFLRNQISFGDWFVAGSFAFVIFSAIWNITQAITQVKSTKELRSETAKLRQKLTEENKPLAYGVKINGLKIKYPNSEEISYPDFTIKKGEKVLLTGDAGTGKSTLFKALLGKIDTEGQITYLDENNQALKDAQVGYLPQDPVVFPVTIKENIILFNQKLSDKLSEIINKVQLENDIEKMPAGLETVIKIKNQNISGGQRQKIVLARSQIHNQPFVLMDEPTSAIDQATTEKIINSLLKSNQTIIMIAHNFPDKLKEKFDQEIHLKAKKERD